MKTTYPGAFHYAGVANRIGEHHATLQTRSQAGPALLTCLLAALLLAGCENETGSTPLGGGEDAHDHDHDHDHGDHPGRLVIASSDGAGDQLYMYDLEEQALLPGSLSLNSAPSALYTSPGKRFVLAPSAAPARCRSWTAASMSMTIMCMKTPPQWLAP